MTETRHPGTGGGSGADVKSGIVLALGDSQSRRITFGTPFASIPHVVATMGLDVSESDHPRVDRVTADDFFLTIYKGHGGTSHWWDIYWIATDAGDP